MTAGRPQGPTGTLPAMADTRPRAGATWTGCSHEGCGGAATAGGDTCLAHAADEVLGQALAEARRSRPLDARGVRVDAALMERIRALAPRDPAGRPVLRAARFDGATFCDPTPFDGIGFEHDATFDRADFADHVSFQGASFGAQARFAQATFATTADFEATTFGGHAWFAAARFGGDTTFAAASFGGPAWFGGTRFDADATFEGATFAADASFDDTTFGCHTFFMGADFAGAARLDRSTFAHAARYDDARFRGPGGAPPEAARQVAWAGTAALAPWPARAGAALVDLAVPLAVVAAAWLAGLAVDAVDLAAARGPVVAAGLVGALALVARNLLDQGRTGQTPGKRRRGLCLVRARDGMPVGPATSLARFALHVIDLAPLGLGLLWPLWDKRGQTLSDKVVATIVVRGRGWAKPAAIGGRGRDPKPGAASGFG